MSYIINVGPIFVKLLLVLNLAYIDYSLYQIWRVYLWPLLLTWFNFNPGMDK